MHELARFLGLTNPAGSWYSFWSGFGSDLPILAGIGLFAWHHDCHEKGCWRPGHPDGRGVVKCRRHREL